MCHLVRFMPVLALPLFWLLPLVAALPHYLPVPIGSAWLYDAVFRLMHRAPVIGPETLLDARARVVRAGSAGTLVRLGNELWRAESGEPLRAFEAVRVTGRRGLVLEVMRAAPPEIGAAPRPEPPRQSTEKAAMPGFWGLLRRENP